MCLSKSEARNLLYTWGKDVYFLGGCGATPLPVSQITNWDVPMGGGGNYSMSDDEGLELPESSKLVGEALGKLDLKYQQYFWILFVNKLKRGAQDNGSRSSNAAEIVCNKLGDKMTARQYRAFTERAWAKVTAVLG